MGSELDLINARLDALEAKVEMILAVLTTEPSEGEWVRSGVIASYQFDGANDVYLGMSDDGAEVRDGLLSGSVGSPELVGALR